MSEYNGLQVIDMDDPDCPQYDDFGCPIDFEGNVMRDLAQLKEQMEEMKNNFANSQRRTEIQGNIIQEMRRRLSEAEIIAEQQQQKIRDLSDQLEARSRSESDEIQPPTAPGQETVSEVSEDGEPSGPEQTDEQHSNSSDDENVNRTNQLFKKVLRLEAKAKIEDDLECKKSLLLSNLGIDNVDLMRENHYPRIKHFLRAKELGFLIDHGAFKVTNVRLYKSGAIKIRYAEEWMAHCQFKKITDFIKRVKSDPTFWGERACLTAHNVKFSLVTPPRFSRERRVLASEGMRLKSIGKIKYFDFLVIQGALIMKTFQRLDGYQFYEANGREVKKTHLSSLNHKKGRYYYNILNRNRGIPLQHLQIPDPDLMDIHGRPLMILDTTAVREARQRYPAMWHPTAEDTGLEPDTDTAMDTEE